MSSSIETEYEATYAESTDCTFILKHRVRYDGGKVSEICSTTVVGFYYGHPNSADTLNFIDKTTATFCNE